MRIRLSLPLALTFIFAISVLLYLLLWHLPLADLRSLQTPDQDENFSDPNYYLYVGSHVCQQTTWTVDDLTVTWSAVGVIGYLNYGCRLFGTEYFYVVLNPLLATLSIGFLAAAGKAVGHKVRISPVSVLFLPYTYLTLTMPGKEIISLAGTMLAASGQLFLSHRLHVRGTLMTAVGLTIIATSRMHEAAALFAFFVLWSSGVLQSPLRLGAILAIASYLAPTLLSGVRLNQDAESLTDEILWSGSSEGKAVDLDAFFGLLRSDNLFIHSLLGIPRVAVVLLSPLSSLITPWTQADFSYFVFRDISQRLRLVDFFFIAWVLVKAFTSSSHAGLTAPQRRIRLAWPSLLLYMLYVISFFGVSQKSRYIFQYTPLLLVWHWIFSYPQPRTDPVRAGAIHSLLPER
jgi:hypothetical protein